MGSISRVRVTLRVFGESLEPDEVSALLACRPTRSQRNGEPIPGDPRRRMAATGAWFLDSDLPEDDDVESHVEALFEKLTSDPDEWESLTSRYAADLVCSLSLKAPNESFEISPRLADALAERRLVIAFDVGFEDG